MFRQLVRCVGCLTPRQQADREENHLVEWKSNGTHYQNFTSLNNKLSLILAWLRTVNNTNTVLLNSWHVLTSSILVVQSYIYAIELNGCVCTSNLCCQFLCCCALYTVARLNFSQTHPSHYLSQVLYFHIDFLLNSF